MSNGHQQQIITENNNPNIRRYISQLYVIPAVDASEAGKGQLEISVNQGQVPNNVQMQDAGRCLVTFIPQHAGTYVIDVTFNGLQVHGCPIKVDVRERQVGKPVSAPVYARPTTSTSSPPPTRGPSSSAYFSSASPQAAPSPSYTAAGPSPSSTPQLPRSPPLVAGVEAALLGGYTVAQYGNGGGGGIPSTTKLKPSPLSTPPSTRPKPKLFEEKEIPISRPSMPEAAQLEMTRSAEMTLFRDIPKTPVTTPVEAGREIPIQHSFERIPEHYQPKEDTIKITQKFNDLPYAPLDQNIKKTLELLNQQQQQGIIREREIIAPPISSSAISPISTESGAPQIHSDIEAMTPGTRRRLLEHSVYKATELKATTPKLSLKFRGSKDKVGSITPPTMTTATISAATASDAFDWGKSKIASKHEVVRRGKEVDVRIDSLKLGKEDQLYVIVLPPGIIPRQNMPNELPTSEQALPHKLKKSGTKSWEISFRPSVVGTHKVHLFVNTIPHPQSPFPIRVYDASQIVVGDIVRQSVLNDTVEFTVDAGRAGFGNLEMAIKDNEGIIIPSHVSQLEAGAAKFLVTFTPNLPGTHTVHITFNKEVVTGSPFEVHIVEPQILGQESQISKKSKKKDKKSKEKHSLNGTQRGEPPTAAMSPTASGRPMVSKLPSLSRVGQPVDLLVTLSRPDDLVQAQVFDLDREPLNIETFPDYSNNICKLQFIPKRVGDHEVEIRVAGTEIDGSPFTCRVYDPTKILVGNIPDGAVDKPVSFVVDASQAGVGNLEVAVNEGKIPSMAYALGQHKYEITFIPKDPIDHRVSVRFNNEDPRGELLPVDIAAYEEEPSRSIIRYTPKSIFVKLNNQPIPGSPFIAKAFDANCVKLALESEGGQVGRSCAFTIDAAKAGAGNMEIIVSVEKRNVPNYVQPEGQAKFRVTFTPQEALEHLISVKFNGISVPGSPLSCPIQLSSVQRSPRPFRAGSELPIQQQLEEQQQLLVVPQQPTSVETRGEEEEEKEIKLVGDLASAIVDEPKRFSIDAPPGIGRKVECNFTLYRDACILDERSFDAIPESSNDEPIKLVEFIQPVLVEHSAPKIDGVELPECPYECIISDRGSPRARGDALNRAQRGKTARFEVSPGTSGSAATELDVIVTNPQGSPLPVRCYKQQDDSYWVEFTPEICGPHRIEVTFGDEPLIGSPFLCEVIDPKRVYVHVSRKSAGDGALNVELVDSQNETLKLDRTKNSAGEDSFTFLPTRLGVHRLSVRLAGFAIPSSPFQIVVEEQKTSPTVYGAALDYSIERAQQASMIFDANKQPGGLKVLFLVEVKSPSGEKVRYTTNRRPDETTEIAFRPQEIGIYEVNIEFNNRLVNGSPFPVTVVDPAKVLIISDDRKQIIRPDGMLQLFVGQRNVINLDCSEAGPAKIRAEVRDADGELLPLEQQTQVHPLDNGKFQLLFTPRKSGKYKIYLYCSELVVPNAYPILAIAEQSTKMPTQVSEMNGERQRRHKEVVEEAAE
uniref:Uncharacterized protein n=1 Tax=Meloidogyne javanica TaxID=6303 RepID=A0A915MT22_MELJA